MFKKKKRTSAITPRCLYLSVMEMRPVSHFWGFEVIWVWGIHIPIYCKGEAKTDSDLIKTHKHVSWRSVHHNLRLPSNLISSLVLVHDEGTKVFWRSLQSPSLLPSAVEGSLFLLPPTVSLCCLVNSVVCPAPHCPLELFSLKPFQTGAYLYIAEMAFVSPYPSLGVYENLSHLLQEGWGGQGSRAAFHVMPHIVME